MIPLLLPLPLIVVANLGDRQNWARVVSYAACGALAAVLAITGVVYVTGAGAFPNLGLGVGYVATGLAAGVTIWPPVRARLAAMMPIEPGSVVHMVALVLTVALAGTQLAAQVSTDVLGEVVRQTARLTRGDLVAQELPFLAAAALGVGIFIRRDPRETLDRLGLVAPRWWHPVLALAAAGAFYAFGAGMDRLGHIVTPGLAHRVDVATGHLFGGLADPIGIATIAIAAGVCEEALFRGALQPRLGLAWAAIVFTSVHTQYGLSVDTLTVLILALGLGLIRRVLNTTSSMVCHVAYNALVGIGLGGSLLLAGIAVEAVLLLTLFALWISILHKTKAAAVS